MLSLILLLLIVWGTLQTDWGQNFAVRQVTKKLSTDLQARISIKHIRLHFFDKLDLQGVFIADQKGDTLLNAGTVQVNITDWFFLKEKAEVQYIGLSNAVVYFNRTDSVWNYRFLEQYFASKDTAKKSAGIAFNIKKAVLNNVKFVQQDGWQGNNLTATVTSLDMDAENIDFSDGIVQIKKLLLVDPFFSSYSYKGRKPKTVDSAKATVTKPALAWTVLVQNMQTTNGRVQMNNQSAPAKAGQFNPGHIDFTAINGTFKNLGWAKDTVRGFITISAKERSGLVIKNLKANTTLHNSAAIFEDLFLQTNKSTLTNYFALKFPNGMKDFVKDVKMEADFDNTTIASNDLAYFLPEAGAWNRVIRVTGKVRGTIDALNGTDMEIWAGSKTYINGNISLVGLPNINETLINIEAKDLRTTYADAVSFVPALRKVTTPNLRQLQYLRFRGVYTGFVNDFVTYGTVQTALGSITSDLNMKLPKGGQPVYSGKIATNGFQLGVLLNNADLGIVDFSGTVKGKSFDWKKLDVAINGKINRVKYGNYTYQNITANGTLSNRKFNGQFISKDANANLTLNGLIDFTGSVPRFDAKANIIYANLGALQLSKNNLELSGLFDLNMSGSSLSNLLGSARISNANVVSNGKELSLDSLNVSSNYVDGVKILRATSNELDATITGDFNLNSLPQSFTFFLSRYYPSYIKAPGKIVPQNFTFDITTGVIEDYIKLVDTSLSGFNNSHITGSLNTFTNTMTVDADVPQFSFKQYDFSDVKLKGNGDYDKLVLTGEANNAVVSQTMNFPRTTFSIEASNDVSEIKINTTANQTINSADIAAQIKTFSDGAAIVFNPSSFVLNGKSWSIEQGGELNFRRNTVVQGQLLLKESNQEIQIATQPSDIGNWNDLHVTLRNINLGDISPFLLPKNRLEGLLNASIVVEDPQNKFNVTSSISTEELRLDNDSLGQIQANIGYNNRTGMLSGAGRNLDPDHHIDFDLALDLKDSANTFQDRISLHPKNFQLKYLDRFLGALFTDVQGYLTGDLNILGEGSNRNYIGKARLKDAGFKVVFTQVFYKLDDAEIELTETEIDLSGLKLRDKNGNVAEVRGNITHKGFANMYFDLLVQTQSRRMELLATTFNDNQQFYGKAYGSGTFVMVGRQNDLLMDIDVTASENDSSTITLPPSRTRESGLAGFLVEKKYGREMNPEVLRGAATNIKYSVKLTTNPYVNMEVILDELTGDVIKGRGSGTLTIESGTTSPLTINGRYNIDEGSYVFTFQSFFRKPFLLRKNSNSYIEWSGDPYNAKIQLEAVYTAENVSFAPLANTLLSGSSQGVNLSSFRDNVNVVATLTGQLFQPSYAFRLEFPGNNAIYRDPSIAFGIQQLERNPNELTKQVSFLIVTNSFAPYESQTSIANPVNEAISNTISGILFGEINKRLNQLLSTVLQRSGVTLNLSGSIYNRNLINATQRGFDINQTDVNFNLGKSFFEGRFIITLGGTFDVPIQSDIAQTVRLLPDVTLEFLINKSGSVRANLFYRENIDFLTSTGLTTGNLQSRRYGASISYGKEFDSFGELILGKKNKGRGKLKPIAEVKPAVVDSSGVGRR